MSKLTKSNKGKKEKKEKKVYEETTTQMSPAIIINNVKNDEKLDIHNILFEKVHYQFIKDTCVLFSHPDYDVLKKLSDMGCLMQRHR